MSERKKERNNNTQKERKKERKKECEKERWKERKKEKSALENIPITLSYVSFLTYDILILFLSHEPEYP